ncbi:MAG: NAD-dependent epimerase/dehydratase family protein [Bacteroidales bacterium]|nr:NAD-dependent epimerase/dehydratase family protein [Bacteroidales bacterium]
MRILLIGGNGLLGHHVARQLLFQGHTVRALLRSVASLHVEHPLLEKRQGSFLLYEQLLEAAQGCDGIVNCAGTTDMSLLRMEDYLPVNRDGVATILRVMDALGISTLVHTSTANTIGYGTATQPADESAPMQAPFLHSLYARSKKAGEALIDAYTKSHPSAHIITLHPGFMLGASDWRNSSGRLLQAAYRKPLMVVPRGGKSFLPVKDAAVAIVNALTQGRNGEHFLLSGQSMTLCEFYRLQKQTCGYKQLTLSLPNWLLLPLGYLGDALRLCGLRIQLSSNNLRQLMVLEHYDNTRAVNALSLPQTPLSQAILDYFNRKQW